MKYFLSTFIFLVLLPFSFVWSSIIIVDINGTGDYTTIQEGIDNASDGDIVLVYQGTYFENIDYDGKNITVASRYYTTGDEVYIKNTIIDGNNNGSCVQVMSGEDNALLVGITLQHGNGYYSNRIHFGGGIIIYTASLYVEKCIILNNKAGIGGGIYISSSPNTTFSGTSIHNNLSSISGGGICKQNDTEITFSQQDLCNIYMNYSPIGSDIYNYEGDMTVYVDTFTVQTPDKFYAYAYEGNITMDILHSKIRPVNTDVYVSTDGDNANSGLNYADAFLNIYHAMIMVESDSTHPNTIYVDEGTYSPSKTGEFFALGGKDHISIIGAGKELTVLDAEQTSNLFELRRISNLLVSNFTLTHGYDYYDSGIYIGSGCSIIFENIVLKDNNCYRGVCHIEQYGDCVSSFNNVEIISTDETNGVAINASVSVSSLFNNCKVYGNKVNPDSYYFGAMTFVNNTCPVIINSSITDNYGEVASGIRHMTSPDDAVYLINCTVCDNDSCSEGTISLADDGHVKLINTILRNDPTTEIWFSTIGEPNSASVEYCNIEGGIDAINTNGNGTVYWGEGNIDEDPLFVGGNPFSYELTKYSPCIDAGTPDTSGLHLPATDLAGNPRIFNGRIDIGAYECQDTFGVDIPDTNFIHNLYFFQNTPNPFTNETEILFITADYTRVEDYTLSIYNTRGQLVRRFNKSNNDFWVKTEVVWDGTDEYGKQVAPGTYLYKIEYNGNAVVRKMLLLR